jgi:hypothetical protein
MTEDRLNMRLDAERSLAPADEPRRHTTTSTADLKRAVCAAVDAMRAELNRRFTSDSRGAGAVLSGGEGGSAADREHLPK